jgi:phosphoribosylformimino-5-aminoimidazole carboxamide ribotide isomerase
LKVIPVIDILNQVAVHAVKGKRSQYKPLESNLCKSSDPLEVAKAFKTLGFSELYVADLDTIIDCRSDFSVLKRVANETGLSLLVDAGITNLDRAERLFESGVSKLIIGTETLDSKKFVAEAIQRFGSSRVVVSLDMKANSVIVKAGFEGCIEPMCLLREFQAMGVSQVIVLDLARVGSGEGVDLAFLKKVKGELSMDVYVGGGVRGIDDLFELQKLGISGALIATALHTGKISIAELKQKGFL